ncbi:MAG: TonB-dependent receptor [Chitinophagaceae bacterium]
MRKYTLIALAVLISTLASAQVSGFVKDQQGKGLAKTTVSLLRAKDSSVVKLSVTDNEGKFTIESALGQFLVSLSHVGYAPVYSNVFEVTGSGPVSVNSLTMIKSEGALQGVTVSSKKPMVEVKADKMILNVEGTINATGNDALELLRKSPGVMLDKDDNISLSGKNGVQIYIDGKPSPLSGADLTAFLKTLQSSQIEAIEIITNPSAKYDAAGNAGIINIRLKKNKAFGTNGSILAGYNIGARPKYNGGISLNHRNGKVNVFGNYNYNWNLNQNLFNLYREQLDTIFDQRSKMINKNISHGFKAGVDYSLNSKHTLGVVVSGNLSDGNMKSNSGTNIVYKPTGVKDRSLAANNSSTSSRDNVNFNLNYRFADTSGHELNLDADYGLYRIKSDQLQPNLYFDPSGGSLGGRIYNMIAPTDIDIYAFKADYEQNFAKGRLGLGTKLSYVKSKNDFSRYNVYTPSFKEYDSSRSNIFNYKENINAAYVNYNRPFKGFMIQFGVRMENTISEGHASGYKDPGSGFVTYDSTFKRNYVDFFPSAALTFNKNPMSQFSLTYSRRIDRPAYQDLNPFEFKLDDYTYQKGNTQLRPQYTNTFGITHTYKYRLNTTLNYSHVTDVFTQLVDTAEKSKAFISKQNLATQDIASLNISYPFQYKSYSAFGNFNGYYSHYAADFGGGTRKINLDVVAFNIYMQHSIKFGKTKAWTGEVSGWYNSPSIWGGTFKSKALWSVDGGVQKTIFKGKGNLKASVSDIFRTIKWKGTSNFAGQYLVASGNFESRQFKVNMTWRFGNMKVKAARQRKTGAEDESGRVGSQGGGGIGQ